MFVQYNMLLLRCSSNILHLEFHLIYCHFMKIVIHFFIHLRNDVLI